MTCTHMCQHSGESGLENWFLSGTRKELDGYLLKKDGKLGLKYVKIVVIQLLGKTVCTVSKSLRFSIP